MGSAMTEPIVLLRVLCLVIRNTNQSTLYYEAFLYEGGIRLKHFCPF